MRLALVCVGKLKAGPERLLFDRYLKRLNESARSAGLAGVDVREIGESRARRPTNGGRGRRRDPGGGAEGRRPGLARRARGARHQRGMGRRHRPRAGWVRPVYAVAIGGPDGLNSSLGAAASNRELRLDDLASPARPGDGRRAALPGDDNSRRPSLSSPMNAAILAQFRDSALHVATLKPVQANRSRQRSSRRLVRRGVAGASRSRSAGSAGRGRSGAREQGDRLARGRT